MNSTAGASDTIELLTALIRTGTVNPPAHELAVANVLADWLAARDVDVAIQPLDHYRANLVATVRGQGTEPALSLCGHMDTVPIGSAAWQHPAFAAEIEDGQLYGRGAADMKGSLAAMAACLARLPGRAAAGRCAIAGHGRREGRLLRRVHLRAASWRDRRQCDGDGKPTNLLVAVAHKGALWVRLTVAGRFAHGSMPQLGSSAILHSTEFLRILSGQRFAVQSHLLLGAPTVSPDQIYPGASMHVLPDCCTISLDIRTVPGLPHGVAMHDLRRLLEWPYRLRWRAPVRWRLCLIGLARTPTSTRRSWWPRSVSERCE